MATRRPPQDPPLLSVREARRVESERPTAAWKAETPKGRGAAPLSLGQVLVGAQAFVAQQTGAAMTQDQWRAVVGERIARHTRVGRLDAGVLQIKVSSSSWCSELSFLKSQLLEKLSRSGREVKDLRLQVSEGPPKPRRKRPLEAPEIVAPVELPAELVARLEKVDDPNLRAAIADAALHSLRLQAQKK